MSWKTDLAFVGALGAGVFLLIMNAQKIGEWLGSQLGAGAATAGQAAFEGAANIAAVPGTALQVMQYEWQLGQQQQFRELQTSLLEKVESAMAQGDKDSAAQAYQQSVEARISALETSPGGISQAGIDVIRAQERETLCQAFGICEGTTSPEESSHVTTSAASPPSALSPPGPAPTQEEVIAAVSPGTMPWNQPGATSSSSTPTAQSAGYSAAQMQAAQEYLAQPGVDAQYVQTFAEPGSPAWVAAQQAGLI